MNPAEHILHGDETYVFADAGYREAEKHDELQEVDIDWHIADQPTKVKAPKQHPRINKVELNIEYMKASIHPKVEHPFRIIKCQFDFTKACYRGFLTNDSKLAMLFTLTNIVSVGQMITA